MADVVVNNNDYCSRVNTYMHCDGKSCGKKHASISDDPIIVDAYVKAATSIRMRETDRVRDVEYLYVFDMETIRALPDLDTSLPKSTKTMFLFVGNYVTEMPAWASAHAEDVAGVVTLVKGFEWKMEWHAYKQYILFVWLRKAFAKLRGVVYYSGDIHSVYELRKGLELEKGWRSASNEDTTSYIFHTKIIRIDIPGDYVFDMALFYSKLPKPRHYTYKKNVPPPPPPLPPPPIIGYVQTQIPLPLPQPPTTVISPPPPPIVVAPPPHPPPPPVVTKPIPQRHVAQKPPVRDYQRTRPVQKRPREADDVDQMAVWHGTVHSHEQRKRPIDFREMENAQRRREYHRPHYDDDARRYDRERDERDDRRRYDDRRERYYDREVGEYQQRRDYETRSREVVSEPQPPHPPRQQYVRPPSVERSFEDSDDDDDNKPTSRYNNTRGRARSDNRSRLHVCSAPPKWTRPSTPDWLSSGDINTNENCIDEPFMGSMQIGEEEEEDRMKTNFGIPWTVEAVYEVLEPEDMVIRFYEDRCFSVRILRDSDIMISPKSILEYLFTGHSDSLTTELRSEYRQSALDMYDARMISGKTLAVLDDDELTKLRNRVLASFLMFSLTVMRGTGSYSAPVTMREHVMSFGKCGKRFEYLKKVSDKSYSKDLRFCVNLLEWMNSSQGHRKTAKPKYRRRIGYCKYLGESLRVFGVSTDVTRLARTKQLLVDSDGNLEIGIKIRRKNKNTRILSRLLEKYKEKFALRTIDWRAMLLTRMGAETQFTQCSDSDLNDTLPKLWGGTLSSEMAILQNPGHANRFARELKRELERMSL